MRIGSFSLLALGLLAGSAAAQDSVVIYRCTDAAGAVSVQNDIPCAKGSQQQRRVIETVHAPTQPPPSPSQPELPPTAVLPPVAPLLEIAGAPADDPNAATVDRAASSNQSGESDLAPSDNQPSVDLEPPPPLFSCRRWDREILLTDDAVPASRCAPLETTGLGGNSAGGAGVACEIKRDICEPVAVGQLCEQWRKYLNDTEALLQFGRAPDPAHTRAEIERISAIVHAIDCNR